MFALLAAGRLVQTNFVQVEPTKYITMLEGANTVNHLAVFLTGAAPLPAGFGASVFFGWPSGALTPTGAPAMDFKFLGYVTNEKPSAIFRLGGQRINEATTPEISAQVGVSIEPVEALQQLAATAATAHHPQMKFSLEEMGEFCRKMMLNFYTYAASFGITVTPPAPAFGLPPPPAQSYFPMDVLQKWYTTVERKMTLNPTFWKEL